MNFSRCLGGFVGNVFISNKDMVNSNAGFLAVISSHSMHLLKNRLDDLVDVYLSSTSATGFPHALLFA